MKIFTIVVIYNGKQRNWIHKCFDSLLASELPTEIIAVDNASKDGSVQFIREEYPTVKLFESAENLGFGGANNIGLKYALENGGDYFFLLNQDARAEPDVLTKLIHGFSMSTGYGIISPMHLNGRGDALDLSFSKSVGPHFCAGLYSDFVLGKVQDKVYEAEFICAAAWLISKECLEKVGGFSPTFFHYAEDDNYIHRLHYHGLKVGVRPDAKIYHDREDRPADDSFENWKYTERNRLLLEISNPDTSLTCKGALRYLYISLLKSLKAGQPQKKQYYREMIDYLKKNRQFIEANLLETKSSAPYSFLN